ncbi:hypothetical protein HU200_042216 [Digitaria exilis]|uniref:Uncharacterized protein n=1 Tax=Digitaria exilis TaxID=1010633 RepID=A0A835EG22_9POAL|nr:hypothetical protein HU200_042216 [Digitaria exilis]
MISQRLDSVPHRHLRRRGLGSGGRAFDAFLETVVLMDMALVLIRDEVAAHARRSHREDVEEKLKLWARAVAREAKFGMLGSS